MTCNLRHPMGLRHPVVCCSVLQWHIDIQTWLTWGQYDIVALLRKMTCNLRHPVGLRHPVLTSRSHCTCIYVLRHGYHTWLSHVTYTNDLFTCDMTHWYVSDVTFSNDAFVPKRDPQTPKRDAQISNKRPKNSIKRPISSEKRPTNFNKRSTNPKNVTYSNDAFMCDTSYVVPTSEIDFSSLWLVTQHTS